MAKIIEVDNLCKSFGENKVLKHVSFSVESGDIVSVIGPSGSGKTTLLRVLTQLEKATSGSVIIDGIKLYESKSGDREALLKTGLVFQSFNLFPHLTVLQNLALPMEHVLKLEKAKAKSAALDLLEKVRLSDKYDSYPCQLSGGQCQRVSIARALGLKPRIVFFDEPTSALDPEMVGGVLDLLRDIAAGDITMVIVTHEINFAKKISTKVMFLEDGRILLQGNSEEVLGVRNRNERIDKFVKSLNI